MDIDYDALHKARLISLYESALEVIKIRLKECDNKYREEYQRAFVGFEQKLAELQS